MPTMVREAWTDERLDDLTVRMDRGFDRVDKDIRDLRSEMHSRFNGVDSRFGSVDQEFKDLRGEMNARFERVDARFDRIDTRFDSLHRLLVGSLITFVVGFFAAFAGLLVTHV